MMYLSFLRMTSMFLTLLTFSIGFYTRPARSALESSLKWRDSRLQMRTLLIDNFDSYTYNIWQLLSEVNGEEPIVVYNNAFNYNWDELLLNLPEFNNIVISPGPGSPDVFSDFGICSDAILRSNLPVLGVCLGHQGIANSFGGVVHRAKTPMHGRLSSISHSNEGLFRNIPQDSKVVRYHSLTVDKDSLPPELRATAWTADNVMMGLEHVSKPIYGVQFHPESISTACGKQLFSNFRDITEKFHHDILMNQKENELKVQSSGIHLKNKVKNVPATSTVTTHDRNIIIARKKFPTTVDVRSIFREIYGDSSASFWLDSSSSGPAQGRSDETTPLSIFGDLDSSKTAYAIEYHGSNLLTKRSTGQKVVENFNMNIFQYLDAELEKNKAVADKIHFCEELGPDSGPRIFEQNLESGQNLPFNMTSAYFGFLGYEARHEATEILTRPYKDTYEKYDLAATHVEGFESSQWVGNLTHPMAFYMHPTQYVVYDHADNSVYVVHVAEESTEIEEGKISSLKTMDRISSITSATAASSKVLETLIPSGPFEASETDLSPHSSDILYAVKSKEEYRADIHKCLEYIRAGESYEICLTLQFKGDSANSEGVRPRPLDVYESLRSKNPAPYSCFLHYDPILFMTPTHGQPLSVATLTSSSKDRDDSHGTKSPSASSSSSSASASVASPSLSPERPVDVDPTLSWCLPGGFTICSSSPERYLKATKDGIIESKPIKGTARRNIGDPLLDAAIASDLRDDEKSQAENLMVVDLVRNDFGRVCEVGSVTVPDLMRVESFASVHQLVSTIRGKLQDGRSLVDAIVATFPGGSMTGAPKLRTMDIIDEIESRPRGIYSGAIGYIGLNGESDLNIVIRTAILAGDTVTVGSGGAIVALSVPDEEVDEVILKAQAVSLPLGYSLSFGATEGARSI